MSLKGSKTEQNLKDAFVANHKLTVVTCTSLQKRMLKVTTM